ncbi:MAG: TIGR03943 family protein [Clostridia bacterium]|nr:TIGR03943 family protein [Clostridia bacterium]MDD4387077.1 TIGR03943 family protein [Clostridia bacterium]
MNFKKQFERLMILSYAIIMLFVVFSGLISQFVHPRMIPYIITCGIILLVFFVTDTFNKKVVSNRFVKSDIIYILPIILIFFVNNGDLSAIVIANKGINVGKSSTENIESNDIKKATEITNELDKVELKDERIKIKKIVIDDSNYVQTIIDISENLDSYIGSEISFDGFVYRDDSITNNNFVAGRLTINCCTADAQLFGYLCKYTGYAQLKDEEWVNITAKIETIIFEGKKIPYLNVGQVKIIDAPKDEYVY